MLNPIGNSSDRKIAETCIFLIRDAPVLQGSRAPTGLDNLTLFLSRVFKFLTALLYIFARAFHRMAASRKNNAEQNRTKDTDLEWVFHVLQPLHANARVVFNYINI